MRLLLESTGEGIYGIDTEGRCTFVNGSAAAMLGYKIDEMIGALVHDLVHHHCQDGSKDAAAHCPILRGTRTGERFRIDSEIFWHRDGTAFPIEYSSHPIIENGVIKGAVITFNDITARRKLQNEAAVREQRLNAFFRGATAGLALFDRELRFVQVNETLAEINGTPAAAHIGRTVAEALPSLAPVLEPILKHVLETGEAKLDVEVSGVTPRQPQTLRHWVASYFPIVDNDSRPNGVGAILVETTNRKCAEEALRSSEERFRQLAENVNEVFWMCDKGLTQMLYVSPAYEKVWGRSSERLCQDFQSYIEWIHPDDRARVAAAADKRTRGESMEIEYRIVRPDGSVRWVRDRAIKILNEAGEFYRLGGVVEDITERKQLELQMHQAQKMESIGRLAGGVAHDFNNILTVIQGHASIVESEGHLPAHVLSSIHEIALAAEHAAGLTRQLLTFSRRQLLQPRKLNVNDVVHGVTKMLRRIMGEDIVVKVEPASVPLILVDPGMLEQILMNLAVNARDAMPQGGRFVISTSVEKIDAASTQPASESAPDEFVCLSVTDSGCGIPPENLTKIFEPFFTTKDVSKGTGLGLATVYGIVKQHCGWITVASEVENGTTFKIYFPAQEGIADGIERKPDDEIAGGTETVLLVEDEKSLRNLIGTCLESYGYRVVISDSGHSALDAWQKHERRIDLVLTDLVMPGGMSGRDLAEQLRMENPNLRVIFMSGYSAETVGKEFPLREGVNFLQKPFAPRKLAACVRAALDREQARVFARVFKGRR